MWLLAGRSGSDRSPAPPAFIHSHSRHSTALDLQQRVRSQQTLSAKR